MTGLLSRMEAKELITRQFSTEDRRTSIIRLSERGQAMREELMAVVEKANAEVRGLKRIASKTPDLVQS